MTQNLQLKTMRIAALMERIAKKDFNCSWYRLKEEDQIRCIQLLVWQAKYKVTVRWIVNAIVPIWREKYSKYRQAGLGVSIATLTGSVSEEILKSKIKQAFPDEENIVRWRAKEQQKQWDRQWDRSIRTENWEHPRKVIRDYSRRMETERKERVKWGERMKRRRYRGNPWV